jgi:hypothetical protein
LEDNETDSRLVGDIRFCLSNLGGSNGIDMARAINDLS